MGCKGKVIAFIWQARSGIVTFCLIMCIKYFSYRYISVHLTNASPVGEVVIMIGFVCV